MAYHRMSSAGTHPTSFPTTPRTSTDDDANAFSYSNVSNVGRMRTSSIAGAGEGERGGGGRETPWAKEKIKHTVSDSLINAGKRLVDWSVALILFVDSGFCCMAFVCQMKEVHMFSSQKCLNCLVHSSNYHSTVGNLYLFIYNAFVLFSFFFVLIVFVFKRRISHRDL
jgi:hypothetical protein